MTNHDLSNNVLQKIKEEHITPKPRWEFLLKDSVVWIAGIISLIIGGLAVSVIIHTIRNDDLELLMEADDGLFGALLIALPYFWILALAAFVGIAHYNYKHTKEGYKYRIPTFLVVAVLVSGFFGVFLYDLGAGGAIDNLLANKVPAYEKLARPRVRIWSRPDRGMVAGTIVEIVNPESFRLRDFHEQTWFVHVSQTVPLPPMNIRPDLRVRCMGTQLSPDMFEAVRILPWNSQPPQPIFHFMHFMPERSPNADAY